MAEERVALIDRTELDRLQRRDKILEWIDADFARKSGLKLSDQVGKILDTGMTMQQMLDKFGQQVRPRRRQRPSEGETAPRSEAAADRL